MYELRLGTDCEPFNSFYNEAFNTAHLNQCRWVYYDSATSLLRYEWLELLLLDKFDITCVVYNECNVAITTELLIKTNDADTYMKLCILIGGS